MPADRSARTLLVVEPMAGDGLEDNLNPVGRTFYGLSTVLREAGFSRVRLATQTPFNLILEARP
jgi:hypothetical protein